MTLAKFVLSKWLLTGIVVCSLGGSARAGRWVTLTNCRYLPNAANDGDSFHVRAEGREYIFRLYFVDAPETDNSIPRRVEEQAKYFHVAIPQTLQIGLEAERFTREKLARPFIVRTCRQDARGRSRLRRYFAFVETDHADLGETLVANGLARVYGASSQAPQMNTAKIEWRKLEDLERKAKWQRIGGWGIGAGRLTTRAIMEPGATEDNLDTLSGPATAASGFAGDGSPPPPAANLDVNTATSEALQDIPGIGPVLAARIIAARPFKSADQLRSVKGIKTKNYRKLRPYFE
ncbi:MAG: helix-hairpin-helix domain-containing protein [Chthoniobacterales bacterium]